VSLRSCSLLITYRAFQAFACYTFPMHFWQLPEEVLLRILSFLEAEDILRFIEVNTRAHNFYKGSSQLQYIVELTAAGCMDTHSRSNVSRSGKSDDGGSIKARLEYLREREVNWRDLKLLRNASSAEFPARMSIGVYDLSSGFFVYGVREENAGLHFLDLKTISSEYSESTGEIQSRSCQWDKFDFKGYIADFGLSLHENDLIALVTYRNYSNGGNSECVNIDHVNLRQAKHANIENCFLTKKKISGSSSPSSFFYNAARTPFSKASLSRTCKKTVGSRSTTMAIN
jgi:hypothetical protein